MIKVRNLNFDYGKTNKILKDVSLDINKGSFVSIIGPNGSGKTTLIKLISKALTDFEGNISIKNEDIDSYSVEALSKSMATIAQGGNVKFPFTCLDIVLMGRNPHISNMSNLSDRDLTIVQEMMTLTDTAKFSKKLITEVSGGEYQRVIFTRALVQETDILILDEAFSAMDISHTVNAMKVLREFIDKKGITVVSVIHDINIAYKYSDHVIVLKEGHVKGDGTPNEVLTEPFVKEIFDIDVDYIEGKGFLLRDEE